MAQIKTSECTSYMALMMIKERVAPISQQTRNVQDTINWKGHTVKTISINATNHKKQPKIPTLQNICAFFFYKLKKKD